MVDAIKVNLRKMFQLGQGGLQCTRQRGVVLSLKDVSFVSRVVWVGNGFTCRIWL